MDECGELIRVEFRVGQKGGDTPVLRGGKADPVVERERLRHLRLEPASQAAARRPPYDLAEEEAAGDRVVA